MSLRSLALDTPSQQGGYIGDGATFNVLTGNVLDVDTLICRNIQTATIATGNDTQPTNSVYGSVPLSVSGAFTRVNLPQPFYYNSLNPADPLNPVILATAMNGLPTVGVTPPTAITATFSAGVLNVYPGCSGLLTQYANGTYIDIIWISNPGGAAPGAAPVNGPGLNLNNARINYFVTGSTPSVSPSPWGGVILTNTTPGVWFPFTGTPTGGIPSFTGVTKTGSSSGGGTTAYLQFSTFVQGAGGAFDINQWQSDAVGGVLPPTVTSTTQYWMPYCITPVRLASTSTLLNPARVDPNAYNPVGSGTNPWILSTQQTAIVPDPNPNPFPAAPSFPGFWIQNVTVQKTTAAGSRPQPINITGELGSLGQQPHSVGVGVRFQVYGRPATSTGGGFWIDWQVGTQFLDDDGITHDITIPDPDGATWQMYVTLGCCGANGTAPTIAWSTNTENTGVTNSLYTRLSNPSLRTQLIPIPA